MKKKNIMIWLNNLNIKKKLMFSYILVVLLPVLLIGIVLTIRMQKMVVDKAMYEATNSVERVYSRLNQPMKLAQDLYFQFSIDSNLENLVLTKYQSVDKVVDAYSNYSGITNATSSHLTEIQDIKLYTYNQSMLNSSQFIVVNDELNETPWLKRAKTLNRGFYWQTIYNPERNSSNLSLIALLKGPIELKPLGILVVSIYQNFMTSIIKDELYETIILDDAGIVLAANKTKMIGQKLDPEKYIDFSSISSGIHDVYYENQNSKAIVKTFLPDINNKEFKIISLVPVSAITGKVNDTFKLGFIMMMISLMLAAALFSFFSAVISKRVKSISNDMHTVALGNFDFSPSIKGEDEIGQLSKDLEVMAKSIKDLVHEVYEVNLQKNQLAMRQKEIKLKMLASQINPHFLFNSLEAIRMRVYCNGDNETAEVIMLLGKIMRKILEIGNDSILFVDEIDLVKSYLEIHKFRFTNRFNYKIDYDCKLANYKMLPFIIQPVIENAVIHGLKLVEEGGIISLTAKKNDGITTIIVEDNGGGINEERLIYVLNSLNEAEESGQRIGLRNVYQRIKLFYGEAGMNINSEPGKGTRVEITLPGER